MTPEQLAAIIEPQPIDGDVIITAGPLLGLGDHSVYSTLAERFAKLGHDVYLDKDTRTSNAEIFDLVWGINPYIKDFSDRKPNAGYVRQGLFYEIANRLPGYRSIEAMERAHALPGPYNMAPKFYYEPKPFKFDLSDTVLIDFSAVSSKIGRRGIREALRMMNGRFRNPDFLQVLHAKHVVLHAPDISCASYQVSSIFEYVDMLAACRAWIGSEAGGQSLAAAVRGERDVYDFDARPEVVCTITPPTFNSRGYTYRNVDYRVTCDTDTTRDYWEPIEVKVLQYENMCRSRLVEMANRGA